MLLCRTLRQAQKNYVTFDPTNSDHLEAFTLLCLGRPDEEGTIIIHQHPTLRFELEGNFQDVRSLMFHKVGEAYMAARDAAAQMLSPRRLVSPGVSIAV